MSDFFTIPRATLGKGIGRMGFFCLAFGAMIGVGWVTAMGPWLQNAGPLGASVAFACGGLLVITIGFCYAEVTAMLPLSGGEVAYSYKAFGILESFLVGWFLTFGYLSVSAFEAISIGKITSYLIPAIDQWPLYSINNDDTIYGSHLLLAIFSVSVITYVNYVGIKESMRFQVYLTLLFLLIVTCVIIAGFFAGKIENLQPYFASSHSKGIAAGIISVFTTVPFWLVGFDTIPQGAEEASEKVSHRGIGIMILVSLVAAVFFYILLIISTSMAGDWHALLETDLLTAEVFRTTFGSEFFSKAILIAIIIGLLTSWNGFFLAGSRVLFAMGRGKIISPIFGQTHMKYGTPYIAVCFTAILTLSASLFGRGAMIAFVDVGSFCIAAAFLGVSLSFLKLRKANPELERPYVTPGGRWMGITSVAGSLVILLAITIPGSPAALKWPLEWAILFGLSVLGLIIWLLSGKSRNTTSKQERDYLILGKFK